MLFSVEDINVFSLYDQSNRLEEERQKERDQSRKRPVYENQVPENFPTSQPTDVQPPSTTPTKRRRSSLPQQAPIPDLMAPSAVVGSVNILPGSQGEAGKAISQTNRDLVANRKALRMGGNPQASPVTENKSAAEALKAELGLASVSTPISAKAALKRKAAVLEEDDNNDTDDSGPNTPIPKGNNEVVEEPEDSVRLWEPGHKERYYEQKFGVDYHNDVEFRKTYFSSLVLLILASLVQKYVEGFCWVLLYYYQGCPSWTWYFPYHFAPFASDFQEIANLEIKLEKGTPFRPAEQLMGVLPAASRSLLPKAFQDLMVDEGSEIIDFYPEDFKIDMNGKKMLWQGVALLPFIDEERLLSAMQPLYDELTEEEHARNAYGTDLLFVGQGNALYDTLGETFYAMTNGIEVVSHSQLRLQ